MDQWRDDRSGCSEKRMVSKLLEQLAGVEENLLPFLTNLLAAECFLGEVDEGAIIRNGHGGQVDIEAVWPRIENAADVAAWVIEVSEMLQQSGGVASVEVRPLDRSQGSHAIIIPFKTAEIDNLVAVFRVVVDDMIALEGKSQMLQLIVGTVGYSQARSCLSAAGDRTDRFRQAMEILSSVNRHEKFISAAMSFCNEIASQWRCERVSLGFLKGRYVQLKAMSHTEDFSQKMEVVQKIASAMEECLDQDVEILSPAAEDAAYISRAADELSKYNGPQTIVSLPLRRGSEVVAVVTLERVADRAFEIEEIETIRLVCQLCSARLTDLYTYNHWFFAVIAGKCRNLAAGLLGPKHTGAKAAVILCFAMILFLMFGKGQYRPKSPFILEATTQQIVPAPFDGYLKTVEVEVGQVVHGDSSILGSLDTAEQRLRLASAKAEQVTYLKQASAARRDNETAKVQIAEANVDKMQAQIDFLNYLIGRAKLISPIDGVVVKGDLKRKIGAPVETGDVLFEISPVESLRAELFVPEEDIFDIMIGQEGRLATASYPSAPIKFVVERINPVAEVVNQRNVFKVRVQLLETFPWMRPGMEGVAKVNAGKRRYVWMWTRKMTNWIRMKLWL
ncbi:MAG TPA: HlyD family efflux transporter periplasmic adaptor subunit [Phycisphaerales bacterium]|nr:HlyD family efflux transporter periplasmic adaptor subunit [Phycisphaerales bacterium]